MDNKDPNKVTTHRRMYKETWDILSLLQKKLKNRSLVVLLHECVQWFYDNNLDPRERTLTNIESNIVKSKDSIIKIVRAIERDTILPIKEQLSIITESIVRLHDSNNLPKIEFIDDVEEDSKEDMPSLDTSKEWRKKAEKMELSNERMKNDFNALKNMFESKGGKYVLKLDRNDYERFFGE